MQKKFEILEFVHCVVSEIIDSVKINGSIYLLTFDVSCEAICNSKALADFAAAGRYRGLSTIYIEHNFFHQIKLGRDVEFQNTHIVLFEAPHDVMRVSTLGAQLGLWWELFDWYRDATSLPYSRLLFDLSPQTDNLFFHCANNGSNSSKFYIPGGLRQSKVLDSEHSIILYPPSVPIIFPQMQNLFRRCCPKNFIRFLREYLGNVIKQNVQSLERHHVAKFQSEVWPISLRN